MWSSATGFGVKLEEPFAPGEEVARGQITHPGYEHVTWQARVVAMDAPRLFSFTWHPYGVDPKVDYSVETPTLVEFRLAPTPAGTRLDIIESGLDAVPAHRRAEAFPRRTRAAGRSSFQNIRAHVES